MAKTHKSHLAFLFLLITVLLFFNFLSLKTRKNILPSVIPVPSKLTTSKLAQQATEIAATPSPTPLPLTFDQLNTLYGPCTRLPVLMYHHVEDLALAKTEGHAGLAVSPDWFQKHLDYLKSHGYSPIRPENLAAFFNSGTPLPPKPIMLTFDDGYNDFYSNAYPQLTSANFPAIVYTITGLVNNPGYLSWDSISQMKSSGLISFSNHTWSHHQMKTDVNTVDKEITLADTQLSDHGLSSLKSFAYPNGIVSSLAQTKLQSLNYQFAFSTRPGSIQCAKQRLNLPRTRVGNTTLSAYGI